MIKESTVIIDSIQNAKKQFVTKYVTDTDTKNNMLIYIEAQTKFLHSAVDTTSNVVLKFAREILDYKLEKFLNPFDVNWFKAVWDAQVKNSNRLQKEW